MCVCDIYIRADYEPEVELQMNNVILGAANGTAEVSITVVHVRKIQ